MKHHFIHSVIAWLGRLTALILLVAIGVSGAWFILQQAAVAKAQQQATVTQLPVATVTAEYVPSYHIQRAFSGRIVARRSSHIGFERAGLLTEVLVDDGDSVSQGQVLAKLDIEPLQLQRRELLAQRDEVQARLKLAKLVQQRRAKLLKTNHSSKQQYDEARFEVEAVAAQLSGLTTAIRAIDLDLKKSKLLAPFAGKIASRLVDEGVVVNAGQVVMQLLEANQLEARIGLPSRFLGDVPLQSQQTVTVNTQTFNGTVSHILPNLDINSRTVTVVLKLDASASAIPPGELVRLHLQESVAKAGAWLPTTALSEGLRGLWTVYAVQNTDVAETQQVIRREVEVLHVETDQVFVRGTLQTGDTVIATGPHRVVPGQLVRIQPLTQVATR